MQGRPHCLVRHNRRPGNGYTVTTRSHTCKAGCVAHWHRLMEKSKSADQRAKPNTQPHGLKFSISSNTANANSPDNLQRGEVPSRQHVLCVNLPVARALQLRPPDNTQVQTGQAPVLEHNMHACRKGCMQESAGAW